MSDKTENKPASQHNTLLGFFPKKCACESSMNCDCGKGPCIYCDDTRVIDSGGSDPWGNAIMVDCPHCKGWRKKYNSPPTSTHPKKPN